MSKFKILKGANSFGEQILSLKDRKTAILNLQNIRMLQTHVNNDIYNKYCLIHNNIKKSPDYLNSAAMGFFARDSGTSSKQP